jgi:hypothetical protein
MACRTLPQNKSFRKAALEEGEQNLLILGFFRPVDEKLPFLPKARF